MTTAQPSGPTPAVAVAYGDRSAPLMDIVRAAEGVCRIVWLIDRRAPGTGGLERMLRRFGPIVDMAGLSAAEAAAELSAHGVTGVATYFDAGLVRLAEIAAELGAPFYSRRTAVALADKSAQREALAAAGIESPGSWVVPARQFRASIESIAASASWPLVLKPRSESGSHHTFLARDDHEALELLESLGDNLSDMVAEEFLQSDPGRAGDTFADYLSVETLVSHGRASHVAISGRLHQAPMFREVGLFLPAAVGPDETQAVIELTDRAITALDISDGCLHTEVKFTPCGPRIIEVNGRFGGGVPEMLRLATGFDALRTSLRMALGEPVEIDGPLTCHCVAYRIFLQPPAMTGTVTDIANLEALADHPGVVSYAIHRGPGATVDWRDGTRTFILATVGTCPDHDGVREVQRVLDKEVVVSYATAAT